MLRRAAVVSRHATLLSNATPHLPAHRIPSIVRPISFLPWRNKASSEGLPVYFAQPIVPPKPGAFRRRLGYSRALFTTLAAYACWQIFATVVFDPLLDWADHEWEALSEKEKKEMEDMADEDEPILFLPFPFTTKEVRQPPYKGSDPEWATFIAVNKDQQLQKDIKLGLAELIRRGVERNPAYVQLLGGRDIKLKKLWLDIIYPPAPPPKHYVSGVIIDDDGIFWGDRPMDSLAANHLNTAIYPKAVALSVWTFINSLARQTAQDIAKALGFNTPPPPEATWQAAILNRIKEQGELGTTGKQTVKVPGQPEKSNFPVHTGISEIPGTPFSGVSQVDPRIQAALQAATVTFTRNWQPAKQPPSRGCIRVDGLVELQGKSAVMAVYVLGWYDPKQRKYMGVQTGLKHLIQLKQRPAGGG
ncbi:hypothetical protein TARUN_4617 [Trichoderma arundinaceum]|uniref:Uncharacterized protein n=1 Tax=Trichoderma arundinaceum TaxID=490622 RepID=A0A395NNX2_TRIAR|nr:hypothetical protein TARUN_4617 [Trichoderma arundinaceum]